MKVTQERLEGSRVALTVEVEPETVSKETERAYQQLGSRVAVPGFRRGKAPRHILRNFIGDQRIRQETLDRVLPDAYRQALQESGVEPLADPEVELLAMEQDQPLSFKATIPVAPTVELGDYRGIRVERHLVAVTEEQVDQQVEKLRRQHATWEPVTGRGIEAGDRFVADVRCEVDGEHLIDDHDRELTMGETGLPREVEEGLTGTQPGEARMILATLSDDVARRDLAGKEATYTISVKQIQQPVLPPVDDALAQKAPETTDLAALRAAYRDQLQRAAEEAEEARVRTAAVDEALARSKVDYPAVLVERRLDTMLESFVGNVTRRGFKAEQYFQLLGITPQDLRDRWRDEADAAVRRELLLDEVARAEGIEPGEDQLLEELRQSLGETPSERAPEELLATNARLRAAVRTSSRQRLALQRLVELSAGAPSAEGTPPATTEDQPSAETPATEPAGLNAAVEPPVDAPVPTGEAGGEHKETLA